MIIWTPKTYINIMVHEWNYAIILREGSFATISPSKVDGPSMNESFECAKLRIATSLGEVYIARLYRVRYRALIRWYCFCWIEALDNDRGGWWSQPNRLMMVREESMEWDVHNLSECLSIIIESVRPLERRNNQWLDDISAMIRWTWRMSLIILTYWMFPAGF